MVEIMIGFGLILAWFIWVVATGDAGGTFAVMFGWVIFFVILLGIGAFVGIMGGMMTGY